jgi:hypothetical protein
VNLILVHSFPGRRTLLSLSKPKEAAANSIRATVLRECQKKLRVIMYSRTGVLRPDGQLSTPKLQATIFACLTSSALIMSSASITSHIKLFEALSMGITQV